MTHTDTYPTTQNLENSTIANYFATINLAQFEQTAALFTEDGTLLAPFEKPIAGRKAIASYLAKEARGMQLLPNREFCESIEDNTEQIKVIGKVKTALFTVNVAWFFSLNEHQQIIAAKIKLLASPQELLGLREFKN